MAQDTELTKFTALGLSGSGKSCYVLGLYAQMSMGVEKFTITAENDITRELEDKMDYLGDEKKGMDRFPSGTSLNECTDYRFTLYFQNNPIMEVSWLDYGGGILHDKGENSDVYNDLTKSIEESTALYIFIDGENLCYHDFDEKKKKTAWYCSSKINPFITYFANKHNHILPPIIFVITKIDLCRSYMKDDNEIMMLVAKCFSSVFGEKTENVYITATTLGKNISDNDYRGEADPNMHIPFFLGLYHEYGRQIQIIKEALQEKIDSISSSSNTLHNEMQKEKNKWKLFRDEERIERIQKECQIHDERIKRYNQNFEKYQSKLQAVTNELLRNSNDFITIKNGQKITFNPELI